MIISEIPQKRYNENELFSKSSSIRKIIKFLFVFILILSVSNCTTIDKSSPDIAMANTTSADVIRSEASSTNLNMYVIERDIPGLGEFTEADLKETSQTSCGVLDEMGSEIQWLHSYVTGDKMYCVYLAPNEEMVLEHAEKGGFPANSVSQVVTIIDPTTAE